MAKNLKKNKNIFKKEMKKILNYIIKLEIYKHK